MKFLGLFARSAAGSAIATLLFSAVLFMLAVGVLPIVPLLVAPAMNTRMWDHPAVQANLATLLARGVQVVEPGEGYLACGWIGAGRLAEPAASSSPGSPAARRRARCRRIRPR